MNELKLVSIFALIVSFVFVIILIPKISFIVQDRNLTDTPNGRSSHFHLVPSMAGVSFFLTLLFMMVALKEWDTDLISVNLIASLGLMFAIGLKDDLIVSTPRAKVLGEIIAVSFIMFCSCLQVVSLNGFLGIYSIHSVLSYVLIVFMFLIIMNSYNLIDGIDGLAACIGIVVFSIYSFLFYTLELHFYFLFCLSLIGILIGYLRFNLSKTKKVFMGDTGSLIIGFCVSFLALKLASSDSSLLIDKGFRPENNIIVIIAIFFIPFMDTIRIISVRLLNKKSIFVADNNHIHHILIDSGLTHFKASLFLSLLHLITAVVLIWMSTIFNSYLMILFLTSFFIFFFRIFYLLKRNIVKKNSSRHLISLIQLF